MTRSNLVPMGQFLWGGWVREGELRVRAAQNRDAKT